MITGTNQRAAKAEKAVRVLLTGPDAITSPRGKLSHYAAPLQHVATARGWPPDTSLCCVLPQDDGSYIVFGRQGLHNIENSRWHIIRARTFDGIVYEGATRVYTSQPAHWYGSADIAQNADTGEMLCLHWGPGRDGNAEKGGHAVWAFGSDDGMTWRALSDKPVYHDHDAFGLAWDRATKQFVTFQATYQHWPDKPYADNAGPDIRRVLHFRTSADGVHWDPPQDVQRAGVHIPVKDMMTPDADDPPELEFYRLRGFEYGDGYAGMMLNYMPSPPWVNPAELHGPHAKCEWWVGSSATTWQRPYRDTFAGGPASASLMHPPIDANGWHRWFIDGEVYGVPQWRIFGVGALSNAECSTRAFIHPHNRLALEYDDRFHAEPGLGFVGQHYIAAALHDEQDRVIEGYEAQRSVVHATRGRKPLLLWQRDGALHSSRGFAGKPVRVRFYFRDARVYGIVPGY